MEPTSVHSGRTVASSVLTPPRPWRESCGSGFAAICRSVGARQERKKSRVSVRSSALPESRRARERIEVAPDRDVGRAVLVGPGDVVEQDLASPADLAQASERCAMARVIEGQMKQLQRAVQRALSQLRVARPPVQRPTHLAPDVAQLFGEGQRPPPSLGRLSMHESHHRVTRDAVYPPATPRAPLRAERPRPEDPRNRPIQFRS